MKILAVDTSTKFLCLGLYDNGKIYEYHLEAQTRMSALIAEVIKQVLDAVKVKPSQIDYYACGIGPGSFTGTRIGVSAIKGLCWALNKPAIGISTLDILAEDVKDEGLPIVPVIDAKRNLVYCAMFKRSKGVLKRVKRHLLLNQEEFIRLVPPGSIVLGDAIRAYRDVFAGSIRGAKFLDTGSWYPKAHNILKIALKSIEEKKLGTAFDIEPLYLYPKECQIKKAHSG